MKNEVKNIRTLMPRAPKGIVTEKKSLKEEYGDYKGEPFCDHIAHSLEDHIPYGEVPAFTGNGEVDWELTINDNVIGMFDSEDLCDMLMEDIAVAVDDGHLWYFGFNESFTLKDVFSGVEYESDDVHIEWIKKDLLMLDVDEEEIDKAIADPDYMLDFFIDYDTEFDVQEWEELNDEEDFDESLKEDFTYKPSIKEDFDYTNTDVIEEEPNPAPGPDMGVANLLITLINGEWDTIKDYNDFIATISAEGGYDDMLAAIQDIVSEENVHVGQLQKLLQQISPDALKIAQGEQEAQEQIDGEDEPEKIDEPVEPQEK